MTFFKKIRVLLNLEEIREPGFTCDLDRSNFLAQSKQVSNIYLTLAKYTNSI